MLQTIRGDRHSIGLASGTDSEEVTMAVKISKSKLWLDGSWHLNRQGDTRAG